MALIGVPPGDPRCGNCGDHPDNRCVCKTCLDKLKAEAQAEMLDPGPTVSRIVDTLMPDDPSQN
jgi:hypothetical protein